MAVRLLDLRRIKGNNKMQGHSARNEPDQLSKIITNDSGISARICPQGHVYLQVGHTCLTLDKNHFVDLAQVVEKVAEHVAAPFDEHNSQTRH